MLYSPLGLYYALALTSQGAEGQTKDEMLDLLGYDDAAALREDCKTSFEALYYVPNEKNNKADEFGEFPADTRYSLQIANSVWADEGFQVEPDWLDLGKTYFYADAYQMDLQSQAAGDAAAEWVKDRTGGLIAPAAAPASEGEMLAIRNTIYFYDEWQNRFREENTKEDTFYLADGNTTSCDFMNRTTFAGFVRGDNYTLSSLSLKNSQMVFVLPDEGTDVHELIKTPETFRQILNEEGEKMSGEVVWKVPKFSYGESMDMSDMLNRLGMEQAFGSQADLSGISKDGGLFLSKVNQDTHIGIDEKGVEAAAYTEIILAGALPPKDRAEMILNRPFLYIIKNKGQILFVGICENPAEQQA